MIVALCTLNTHAHENLCSILGDLEGITLDLIVVGGRGLKRASSRGENFLNDFIYRYVGSNTFLEPVVVKKCGLVTDLIVLLGADLQVR